MNSWMQKSAWIQKRTSSLKLAAQPAITCTFASYLAPIEPRLSSGTTIEFKNSRHLLFWASLGCLGRSSCRERAPQKRPREPLREPTLAGDRRSRVRSCPARRLTLFSVTAVVFSSTASAVFHCDRRLMGLCFLFLSKRLIHHVSQQTSCVQGKHGQI